MLLAGIFWYWCYYPHHSRDALSPVWGIFHFEEEKNSNIQQDIEVNCILPEQLLLVLNLFSLVQLS